MLHLQSVNSFCPVPDVVVMPGQVMHVSLVVAAVAAEYVPTGHLSHEASPTVVLYRPATHAVHVPPFDPEYPMLHWHAVITELPSGDCALGSQSRQKVAEVAAIVVE